MAKAGEASLKFLTVDDGGGTDPAVLERAVRAAGEAGLGADTELRSGAAATAVLEVANQDDVDLVVLGSRGLSMGDQVIGSVSHRIVRHAPCDVLLVRKREEPEGMPRVPYAKMMIATDGSPTADRAARKGFTLAKLIGAKVTLIFVGHPKTGELVLKDTHATMSDGVETWLLSLEGDPGEAIIGAALEDHPDLIVVGNKGIAGAKGLLLASVPKTISEYSPCDVLIARTVTQSIAELGKDDGGIVKSGDRKLAVYRDKKGKTHALSAKCTHMGCTVAWNTTQRTWDCPCHGSRFSPAGEVVNGPATKPLPPTDL